MNFRDPQTIIEQVAILFASFVWTTIVLVAIMFFWAYQDVQARWEYVINAPPEALAQAQDTPTPTATLWAGPGATLTPTPTQPPTTVPTRVIEMPSMLPETLNPGETSIPVIVHTQDEANEFDVNQQPQTEPAQNQGVVINIRPTPVPATVVPSPGNPQPAVANNIPSDGLPPVGSPTRLVINSIGVDSPIIPVGWSIIQKDSFEYSIWQVADYAVGWHKTTAPLGQPGNSVMAGHHNVNGEVFRDLVNVEVGDKVTVYSDGQKFEYIVELKTIVKEKGEPVEVRKKNAQWISPTEDERLTFVTCWPYTNNTHRVIVVAKPI